MPSTYTGFELLRTFRNKRFMIISLAFPLVLFFLVAGPNRDHRLGGIPFAVYYMTGMAAWGSMAAMLSCGARIATERSVGWTRLLRTYKPSTAVKWLHGFNAHLGNRRPISLLKQGRVSEVIAAIEQHEAGSYA